MSKAALDAVLPPAPLEEKRRKQSAAHLIVPSPSGSGCYAKGDVPRELQELADLIKGRRRIPEGAQLDYRAIARYSRQLRRIRAI